MKKCVNFFVLSFIVLSFAACAPVKPEDPAYHWASGEWIGVTGPGNPAELSLRVINGNRIVGDVIYHSSSGRIAEGVIKSGLVGQKDDVPFIEGEILWGSGSPAEFRLGLVEGHLLGQLGGNRIVNLTKAK